MKTSTTITCSHAELQTSTHQIKCNNVNRNNGAQNFLYKKKQVYNTLHKDLTCKTFVYITYKY